MSGRCWDDVGRVSGVCLECIKEVSGKCVEVVCKVIVLIFCDMFQANRSGVLCVTLMYSRLIHLEVKVKENPEGLEGYEEMKVMEGMEVVKNQENQ